MTLRRDKLIVKLLHVSKIHLSTRECSLWFHLDLWHFFFFFNYSFSFFKFYYYFFYFTILYWFCHTSTCIHHGCTCVPHPEPHYHLPPHLIPQGHPSAPVLSTLSHASNLDWQSVSNIIIYMFQCYSLKSSHPYLLPQNPKDCFIHLCLFCCLSYKVIITIFLNSIYMR